MILSIALAFTLGMSSCSGDPDVTYAPSTETISVSQTSLNFSEKGGSTDISVEASHEFVAYSNQNWLSVSPTNSTGKSGNVTIDVAENKTDSTRTGNITITSGGTREIITVTQSAGESIKAPLDGYELAWNDEFDGNALSGDWTFENWPAGQVNNEMQKYVNDADVAQVSDGTLKINLIKDGNEYKSSRLYAHVTTGWKYGYIEARIKLPKGKGTWPAFWMMPVNFNNDWPASGEIDIMEHVGFDENVIHSTIHCTKYNNSGTATETAQRNVSGATSEFHTYGMEWTADYMAFYIDGTKYFTYKNDGTGKDAWPFDAAFYPILNLAYGGQWGGQQGTDDSCLPATMEVDYVRVFQK